MSIPKIIHFCWLGGKEKPASVKKCIESWKKYCPDFEIKEWNESNLDLYCNSFASQAYEAKAWGFVPDYYRLKIVYDYGGVYLDTDVELRKSLTPLLAYRAFAGFEAGTASNGNAYVNFGQGFGAEKGNSIIKKHLQLYSNMQYLRDDGSYNRTPSPQYTTRILKEYGLDTMSNTIQDLGDIVVFPVDYFCPIDYSTGRKRITKNTYSIHHFSASWHNEVEREERRKHLQQEKKKYILHTPYRIARKLLGNRLYEQIRSKLKKEKAQ